MPSGRRCCKSHVCNAPETGQRLGTAHSWVRGCRPRDGGPTAHSKPPTLQSRDVLHVGNPVDLRMRHTALSGRSRQSQCTHPPLQERGGASEPRAQYGRGPGGGGTPTKFMGVSDVTRLMLPKNRRFSASCSVLASYTRRLRRCRSPSRSFMSCTTGEGAWARARVSSGTSKGRALHVRQAGLG